MNKINFFKLLTLVLCLTFNINNLHSMNKTTIGHSLKKTSLREIVESINQSMDLPIVMDRDIEDISVRIQAIDRLNPEQIKYLFITILEVNSLVLIKKEDHYQITHFSESKENPYPAPII